MKSWEEAYNKAYKLVSQMSLVEKGMFIPCGDVEKRQNTKISHFSVNITTGTGFSLGPCVGNTGPVGRLGFPSICLQDGPLGVRGTDKVTGFPAGITTGSKSNGSVDPHLFS